MQYKEYFQYLHENVEDYLVWEPVGDFKKMTNQINLLNSSPSELYRGASDIEVKILQTKGTFQSKGSGNTRKNAGTYVTSDVHLAGAFAIRYFRDGHGGSIIVLEKSKIKGLTPRDPGNFTVDFIALDAVKRIINLKDYLK